MIKKFYDFEICLLDREGSRHKFTSSDFSMNYLKNNTYLFDNKNLFDGEVIISSIQEDESATYKLSVNNNTDLTIESIKFPIIRIPCKMKGDGGDTLLFWPSMEGAIIERAANKFYSNAVDRGGPGYTGLTPGGSAMQFMAVYSDENGL